MIKQLCPHDRFTRSSMSHPKVAEEFFEKYLPDKIRNIIDFDSLKLQKESYINDNLKLQITDLLYAVQFGGQPGFLYILIEHASQSDPLLPFRMLKYMVAIMEDHLKDAKNRKLPFVYPLIFYTGKKPYAHSMDLFDLFAEEEKELAKETLLCPYHLIDLSQDCDQELKKYLWLGIMARSLRHSYDSDILPYFESIVDALRVLANLGAESYINSTIAYLGGTGTTKRQKDMSEVIKTLEFVDEEKVMSTLVDYLQPKLLKIATAKAKAEARAEALKEGRQEKDEAILNIAKAFLLKGISVDAVAEATNLSKNEIRKLLH